MSEPFVGHNTLAAFADREILLPKAEADACRQTVEKLNSILAEWNASRSASGMAKFLLSGPLAKGLALRTMKAIDVALYIDPAVAPADSPALLDWVLARLNDLLPPFDLAGEQPPAPALSFATPEQPRPVLLTPVYQDGSPDGGGFQFAKETGERVRTSIPVRIAFTRRRVEAWPDNFARAYALAECWLGRQRASQPGFRFKSFLTELICAHLSDIGVDFSDVRAAFERFLRQLAGAGLKKRIAFFDSYGPADLPPPTGAAIEIFDPVNPLNNVAIAYSEAGARGRSGGCGPGAGNADGRAHRPYADRSRGWLAPPARRRFVASLEMRTAPTERSGHGALDRHGAEARGSELMSLALLGTPGSSLAPGIEASMAARPGWSLAFPGAKPIQSLTPSSALSS